jgi:hypothetical protein
MKFIKESSRSTQTIDIFFILHATVKIPFTRRSGYDQELLTHYKFHFSRPQNKCMIK